MLVITKHCAKLKSNQNIHAELILLTLLMLPSTSSLRLTIVRFGSGSADAKPRNYRLQSTCCEFFRFLRFQTVVGTAWKLADSRLRRPEANVLDCETAWGAVTQHDPFPL